MLTKSFCWAKGMTEELERELWARGVTTWDDLRKHRGEAAAAIGESRARRLVEEVNQAQEALEGSDHAWFAGNWPEKESWRLWKGFCEPGEVALVDIETTGRTPGFDQITVIGCSNGSEEKVFVADVPLPGDEPLPAYLEHIRDFRLLVTFNGVGFDVPFLEKHFRAEHYRVDQPHIDLIFPARSLGLTGGLKDMEKQLGIAREEDIAEIRGGDAIALWGAWKRGDRAAYEKLTSYCKADCTNLAAFAEEVYRRKWDEVYTPYAREIDLDSTMGEQLSLF